MNVFLNKCCRLCETTHQVLKAKTGKLEPYAMKRVAAGAHLPTPWLFEPAKRPDDTADYRIHKWSRTERYISYRLKQQTSMKARERLDFFLSLQY